ncbi:hypothetical protein FB480_11916 [Agrobacterium vitis]|nr:hypothetical protein FB480_11916 [Agrobacterium vitis]
MQQLKSATASFVRHIWRTALSVLFARCRIPPIRRDIFMTVRFLVMRAEDSEELPVRRCVWAQALP